MNHNNSTRTSSDEVMKHKESGYAGEDQGEDSRSLTASDFEVLNSENFFDKINDALQSVSIPHKPEPS